MLSLLDLPDEVLDDILSKCSAEALAACSSACRRLRRLAGQPRHWRPLALAYATLHSGLQPDEILLRPTEDCRALLGRLRRWHCAWEGCQTIYSQLRSGPLRAVSLDGLTGPAQAVAVIREDAYLVAGAAGAPRVVLWRIRGAQCLRQASVQPWKTVSIGARTATRLALLRINGAVWLVITTSDDCVLAYTVDFDEGRLQHMYTAVNVLQCAQLGGILEMLPLGTTVLLRGVSKALLWNVPCGSPSNTQRLPDGATARAAFRPLGAAVLLDQRVSPILAAASEMAQCALEVPAADTLITGGFDGRIRVYALHPYHSVRRRQTQLPKLQPKHKVLAHAATILAMAATVELDALATGAADGTMRLFWIVA